MKKISKAIVYILIILSFSLFTLFLFTPKYLVIDYILSNKGIFLIPEGVNEMWDKVILKRVKVFLKNEEEAYFDRIDIKIDFFGIRVEGKCKGGVILLELKPYGYDFKAKDFTCLKRVPFLKSDINIHGGKIFGNLYAEGLEVEGRKINVLSLIFEGNKVGVKLNVDGFELKGKGKIDLNIPDITKTSLNINLSGVINARISGTLENPVLNFR